jgi:hypothetical protein
VTANTRETVRGFWKGQKLGPMERCSIQSFLDHGHPYHLFAYDDIEGVPAGAIVRDGNDIVPRDQFFLDDRFSSASFADLFRYTLLHERGGYWADLDVICLKPFSFLQDHVFTRELEPDLSLGYGNCVIKAPPRSPVMAACRDACVARGRVSVCWGEFGPALLGRTATELGFDSAFVSYRVFCPVPSWEWETLVRSDRESVRAVKQRVTGISHAIHLWAEMWRLAGADRDRRWSPGCVYEQLKNRYQVNEDA